MRQYRKDHPEKKLCPEDRRIRDRNYRASHIEECRAREREKSKLYRKRHPEKVKQSKREAYFKTKAKDPEGLLRKKREYARRYLTPAKMKEVRRRRLEFMLAGNVTRLELIELFEKSDGCCKYCGVEIKRPCFTPHAPRGFDHVIPFCKGGKHEISNMVVCCKDCNAKKGHNVYEKEEVNDR